MNSTQMRSENATQNPKDAMVDLKLEVVVLPVSDVDRAKRFYQRLGWRLDADFTNGDDWRVVQLTPPGSPCSILFGKGITTAVPGSVQGNFLVVDDIEAARAELIRHDVDASEVFHFAGGLHVDEIKRRLPGRGFGIDVATLTELLREAEKRHGEYEPTAPKHHWSGWYAAYIVAREQGKTPDEAAKGAALHMEGTHFGYGLGSPPGRQSDTVHAGGQSPIE